MSRIFESFMNEQRRVSREIADQSALVDVEWLDDLRVHVRFGCRGLVRFASGAIGVHDRFDVGVRFGEDHLRHVHEPSLVSFLGPVETWHSNVRPPFVCLGPIAPGTGIEDLIHRLFDVIVWSNATLDERDALNHAACAWGREHLAELPVDTRPLKWRPDASAGGVECSESSSVADSQSALSALARATARPAPGVA